MEFTPQLNAPFIIDFRNVIHCSLLVAKMRNSVNEVMDTGPLSWPMSSPQTSNFCLSHPCIFIVCYKIQKHLLGTPSHGHWEVLKAPRILGSVLGTILGVWRREKNWAQSQSSEWQHHSASSCLPAHDRNSRLSSHKILANESKSHPGNKSCSFS